jgi:signal transduction histidine kinase
MRLPSPPEPRTAPPRSGYLGHTSLAAALLGTLLGMLLQSRRQQRQPGETLGAERARLRALEALAEGEARLRRLNEELERLVQERTRGLAAARDVAESSNRGKDMFLATMSHEMRTPLNSIIGFSDVLLGGMAGELNEEQRTQLGIIHKSGQQLRALIGDVLDISKIEAGQLRLDLARVPLQDVLLEQRRVFELQAHERGLQLEYECPPEPIEVVADPQRLRQVIGNLMSNALKFTDRGSVGLVAERLGDRVRITVHDSGVGIAPADQPDLFKPFRRLAPRHGGSREGTGLGLATSHRLVQAMGGEMGVSSEPGRGSRFWFTLPSG